MLTLQGQPEAVYSDVNRTDSNNAKATLISFIKVVSKELKDRETAGRSAPVVPGVNAINQPTNPASGTENRGI